MLDPETSCETSEEWIRFSFLDRIYRIDGIFSPSARSPFGRRPFYPDDPVDPVQFSFKDENPFLIFAVF